MPIIYSYPLNVDILDTDILVGTSTVLVGPKRKNQTKSFSMLDIYGYIVDKLPEPEIPTLQQVTDIGSTTTNNITANGFIKSGGTSSQFLKADGSVDTTTYLSSIPTLQQVATAGNTTNLDININSLTVGKGSGTGINNTAVGNLALNSNITGNNNTATGKDALSNNTSSNNTANGANTLRANTSGDGNTAIGYQSLIFNTTGRLNTGLGMQALVFNTTGIENVAVGFNAIQSNTSGSYNTASGNSSLFSNTTGNNNTGVGNGVLGYNRVGSNNTALGVNAGGRTSPSGSNITSNNSVFLGSETKALGNDQTNQIVIGHNAIGLGSNSIVLGNSLTIAAAIYGNLLLGSTSNNGVDKLQINGSLVATSIKKLDGTSSEFLMADGSVTTAVTPTIPTLQQVTAAGATTDRRITLSCIESFKGSAGLIITPAIPIPGVSIRGEGPCLIAHSTGSNGILVSTQSIYAAVKGENADTGVAVQGHNLGDGIGVAVNGLSNSGTAGLFEIGLANGKGVVIKMAEGPYTGDMMQFYVGTVMKASIDHNGNFKIPSLSLTTLNTAPANASASGTLGEIRWDANYMYVCVATNTWKRSAITTW
jgi:hypothetical protein